MSRTDDVLAARAAADDWATSFGLPPSGGYSGDWYINGYLGGWWPTDWLYWLADYGLSPTVLPMRPIHQYTSSPIDMDVMLESEIVTGPEPPPEPDPRDAIIASLRTTIAVMDGNVGASIANTAAILHKNAAAKRMKRIDVGGSANNLDLVVKELHRLRQDAEAV